MFFCSLALRVATWFEHPNILISGDYRPQLNQQAFTNRITYTWDQTDPGGPSVYAPKILVPSYFFMTVFNILQITSTSQAIALFLMMFLSSVLMYMYTKKILGENVVAAFISGLYFTSNIFMINDREMTAVAFRYSAVILPCIILFAGRNNKKIPQIYCIIRFFVCFNIQFISKLQKRGYLHNPNFITSLYFFLNNKVGVIKKGKSNIIKAFNSLNKNSNTQRTGIYSSFFLGSRFSFNMDYYNGLEQH